MATWNVVAAEEWFRGYAARCNTTVEELRRLGTDVYPCVCDGADCAGWAAVGKTMVFDHFQLYARQHTPPAWVTRESRGF
jgi:hypothetical protein